MSFENALASSIESFVARGSTQKALRSVVNKLSNKKLVSRKDDWKIRKVAQELADALTSSTMKTLYSATTSGSTMTYHQWFVSNVELSDDGHWVADVVFRGPVTRESLNPNSDGVTNILGLLNTGFHVSDDKRPPVGVWHGKSTIGLRDRPPSHFLDDAIEDFNSKYDGDFYAVSTNSDLGIGWSR